jgi:hypothetical protein
MYHTHGVIVADDFESGRRVSVGPSNGRVLADFNPLTEGAGYGFAPLVLPVVALVVLRRQAARRVPSAR